MDIPLIEQVKLQAQVLVPLVKALRADPRYHASRIVMVTTETAIGRMNEALGEGADEYLMKPFLREALLEKLRILGLPVVAPTPIGGA